MAINGKVTVNINPSDYKVLVVDDVMPNVLLLKVMLSNEKFNVITASNGEQAIEQVRNYGLRSRCHHWWNPEES